MEPEYKRAIALALRERRMWTAGLITALALSEAWWVIFGWGPEYLGERWERAVSGWMGDGAALVVFILAAVAAFALLKAIGYAGEMVLVRQVADQPEGSVTPFSDAFTSSRRRYLPFAVTLLPYDALRLGAIYLPAVILAIWDKWDPNLDHIWLYLLAMLIWFGILMAVLILAGITAVLAARFSLLQSRGIPEAWVKGWNLFRDKTAKCFTVWLQAISADIIFVVIAWPLTALVPWAVGALADSIGFAPIRWFIYGGAYLALAVALIAGQTWVQCYKSSLWTLTYLELAGEIAGGEEGREIKAASREAPGRKTPIYPQPDWFPEPPPDFMPRP